MLSAIRSGPIRYALAGRFEAPRRTDPDSPELTDGAICPQPSSRLEHVMGPPPDRHPRSEDCLALSIVAPATPGPHPVMVFLHGGGFFTGSGLQSWYDGTALATEQQVVVVSVSYRLGPFGWLVLDDVSPGNLGLLDQITALRWVHGGIDRFGGDPSRVTVFGQSAGASSIGYLLESTEARPFFRRAILQSGPALDLYPDSREPEIAARTGRRFAEILDADPRDAAAAALLDAVGSLARERAGRAPGAVPLPLAPVRGLGPVPAVPGHPVDPESLDLLVGWNAEELTAFGLDVRSASPASHELFAGQWSRRAPLLRAAGVRLSGYRLDWRPRGSPFGATHCLELPLLLGSHEAWRGSPMLGDEPWDAVARAGRRLRAAWAEFARTGRTDPGLTSDFPIRWAPSGPPPGARSEPSSERLDEE